MIDKQLSRPLTPIHHTSSMLQSAEFTPSSMRNVPKPDTDDSFFVADPAYRPTITNTACLTPSEACLLLTSF